MEVLNALYKLFPKLIPDYLRIGETGSNERLPLAI
jgi:hypothetical protein